MDTTTLADHEFKQFRDLIYQAAGIALSPAKKALVMGRLSKRLRALGLDSYGAYHKLLVGGRDPAEMQRAVDLLTTNETYFFREPKHFEFLRDALLPAHPSGRPFRVWSAASSSGQEAYSIAMLLAERLGTQPWQIVGSDISVSILEKARAGHYPLEQAENIPRHLLTKYCLKGVGSQSGTFLIGRTLRERVRFMQANLNDALPPLDEMDVVFLRNVMIYFDTETKRQVVERVAARLRPGGHLLIGHSESLNGICGGLKQVMPAVYRKP